MHPWAAFPGRYAVHSEPLSKIARRLYEAGELRRQPFHPARPYTYSKPRAGDADLLVGVLIFEEVAVAACIGARAGLRPLSAPASSFPMASMAYSAKADFLNHDL
jgi:hypothetical protein